MEGVEEKKDEKKRSGREVLKLVESDALAPLFRRLWIARKGDGQWVAAGGGVQLSHIDGRIRGLIWEKAVVAWVKIFNLRLAYILAVLRIIL